MSLDICCGQIAADWESVENNSPSTVKKFDVYALEILIMGALAVSVLILGPPLGPARGRLIKPDRTEVHALR